MYRYEDIKEVHLEITEKCQAACPMCMRNQNGGADNPHLTMSELSLEDCKKIFEPDFLKQLHHIYMCGNFGDPCIAQDTLEVYRYFRKHNPNMVLGMHTNAGARKAEWWAELAEIFAGKGGVVFSVDGLEDTNHLYRQNVNWDIVVRSMEAFIGAGGTAKWDYIVFEHNEHQVAEAETFAKKLGFKQFRSKKTDRFFSPTKGIVKEGHQAVDRKEKNTQLLTKPKTEKYVNKGMASKKGLLDKYGGKINYYNQATITCKVLGEKKIFISAEGLFLPCCWTAIRMYRWWEHPESAQIWDFIKRAGGKEGIDVINNSIKYVMNGTGFLEDIKNSWSCSSIAAGKLDVCADKCGEGFDTFSEQFAEKIDLRK